MTCAIGTSGSGQLREQLGEDLPAHLAMHPADPVDERAAAHGQIRHVERLRLVAHVRASEREQVVSGEPGSGEPRAVREQVALDHLRIEPIEACDDGSVGREDVSGARGNERFGE